VSSLLPAIFYPFDLSSSAKADDPVNTDANDSSDSAAITGCPAFAGHDAERLRS
jgi:hypothetical protein